MELDGTLSSDSRTTTRTIRAKVNTPDEINEMFDDITYNKAGAVIGMVENYLGEEVFRKGVQDYLGAHLYGNATGEDFWTAETAASKLPVDKIMQSFVEEPGVPLLTFGERTGATVLVKQGRFFTSGDSDKNMALWTIPVCFKTADKPVCEVVTPFMGIEKKGLPVPAGLSSPFADAGGKGYYRATYGAKDYAAILGSVETALTPPERIGLIGDRWALTRSGQESVGEFLNLALALKQEQSAAVLVSALNKVMDIHDEVATPAERVKLEAVVQREYAPVLAAMGGPTRREQLDRDEIRSALFTMLGIMKDPGVLAQSRQMSDELFSGKRPSDPSLIDAAVQIAATNGDAEMYARMLAVIQKTGDDPGLQAEVLHTLPNFTATELVNATLEYAVSDQVRNQDSASLLAELLEQAETQTQAWDWIRKNWTSVQAKLTNNSGARVVGATHVFCTAQQRDEVSDFFGSHHVDAAERTLMQSLASIDSCIQLRAAQEPKLRVWLDAHAAGGTK